LKGYGTAGERPEQSSNGYAKKKYIFFENLRAINPGVWGKAPIFNV